MDCNSEKFDQFFPVSPVYSGEIDRQKPDAILFLSGEIPWCHILDALRAI